MTHRIRTRFVDPSDHETKVWWSTSAQAACDCGWLGKVRENYRAESTAKLDGHRHLVEVGAKPKPQRRNPTRPRDGRKNKVYAAERRAFPLMNTNEWKTAAEAQAELNRWLRSVWFRNRFPRITTVPVHSGAGSSWGNWTFKEIKLWGGGHLNRYVLAHELAHVLVSSPDRAGHDKHFCGTYVALVQQFISKEAADALRAEFVASKIPHRVAVKPAAKAAA